MREMEQLRCVSPHKPPSARNHSVQSLVTGIMKQFSGQTEKDFSFHQVRRKKELEKDSPQENSLQM